MSSRVRRGAIVWTIVVVPLCAACATIWGFDDFSSETRDAGADAGADGGEDAGEARCPSDGLFVVNPEPLFDRQIEVSINADRQGIHLSKGETEIYFSLDTDPRKFDSGPDRHDWKLYMATRGRRDQKFGPAQTLPKPLNDFYSQRHPTLDRDGKMILFAVKESGPTHERLYYATRDTESGPFRPPQPLPDVVNELNSNFDPFLFTLSDGGKELWYVHIAPNTPPPNPLRHTRLLKDDLTAPSSFEKPQVFDPTPESEVAPVLSVDGLEIYFSREEGDPNKPNANVWRAHRATTEDPFVEPEAVKELNTEFLDRPGWLSPDGCRLYFLSSRGTNDTEDGALNIYVAERSRTSP